MNLWQKEDKNNDNRPTLQPFKVFSESYNQQPACLFLANVITHLYQQS